jgi:hypothetical protein
MIELQMAAGRLRGHRRVQLSKTGHVPA